MLKSLVSIGSQGPGQAAAFLVEGVINTGLFSAWIEEYPHQLRDVTNWRNPDKGSVVGMSLAGVLPIMYQTK